ncbi:hypothetical protein CHU98_g4819 [Xylaria longipes]|nr:hypothetical protein CHU98_g4819 [Xylaria longipes]
MYVDLDACGEGQAKALVQVLALRILVAGERKHYGLNFASLGYEHPALTSYYVTVCTFTGSPCMLSATRCCKPVIDYWPVAIWSAGGKAQSTSTCTWTWLELHWWVGWWGQRIGDHLRTLFFADTLVTRRSRLPSARDGRAGGDTEDVPLGAVDCWHAIEPRGF